MPTSLQAKLVKCPFYMNDDRSCISCEGPVEESRLRTIFIHSTGGANPQKKSEYLKTYCCRDYTKCIIHKILMEKYDEQI